MAPYSLNPRFIVENGKPTGVILDLAVYEDLLERLEQREDLDAIQRMTQEDWERVSLKAYRQEQGDADVPG